MSVPTKFLPHMSFNQILLQMSSGTKLRAEKKSIFKASFCILELQTRGCGPMYIQRYAIHISVFLHSY